MSCDISLRIGVSRGNPSIYIDMALPTTLVEAIILIPLSRVAKTYLGMYAGVYYHENLEIRISMNATRRTIGPEQFFNLIEVIILIPLSPTAKTYAVAHYHGKLEIRISRSAAYQTIRARAVYHLRRGDYSNCLFTGYGQYMDLMSRPLP